MPKSTPNKSATATAPVAVAELSFEDALDELDRLVRQMESGELGLDTSIAAYRRGAELAKFCQTKLAHAELEIRKLDGDTLETLDESELRGAGDGAEEDTDESADPDVDLPTRRTGKSSFG